MKIFKFTAPNYSEADIWYATEKDWHVCLDAFECQVEGMEVNVKLTFEVEILELTENQWRVLQDSFIEE